MGGGGEYPHPPNDETLFMNHADVPVSPLMLTQFLVCDIPPQAGATSLQGGGSPPVSQSVSVLQQSATLMLYKQIYGVKSKMVFRSFKLLALFQV